MLHPLPSPSAPVTVSVIPLHEASSPTHPLVATAQPGKAWRIDVDLSSLDRPGDLLLSLDLDGSIARLYAGERLLTDVCLNGETWEIALRRHRAALASGPLILHVSPLGIHDSVHLPWDRWPASPDGKACAVRAVRAHFRPEIRLCWDS